MVQLTGGISEAGPNILGLQIRKIRQNRIRALPRRQHVEHIFDANTHPPNARLSTALIGIKGNAIELAHADHDRTRIRVPQAHRPASAQISVTTSAASNTSAAVRQNPIEPR